jgi:uncharacterized protein (TIGR02266 family)
MTERSMPPLAESGAPSRTPAQERERRDSSRGPVSGVTAVFEDASGDTGKVDVGDIGRGGLFLRTDSPMAVGKRLSLEIRVAGEVAGWSALGRVVWVRPPNGQGQPAGMGIRFIDTSDGANDAIDRLVQARAEVAFSPDRAPVIERSPSKPGPPGASAAVPFALVELKPGPRGPFDAAHAAHPESDAEVAIDLVTKKINGASARPNVPEASGEDLPVLPRNRAGLLVVAALIAAAAAGVYLMRGHLRPL